MPYVFDRLSLIQETLRQSPFGLITDVDGTISQIAPDPRQARVSPLCCYYLSILCHQLPLVAAISGRRALDIKNMIGVEGIIYIGNHGMERLNEEHSEFKGGTQEYAGAVKSALAEIAPSLSSIEGVYIEDKGVSASIHYRLSPQPKLAQSQILSVIKNSTRASQLRIIPEKTAVDILLPVNVNKGTATLDLLKEYKLHGGIYVGDDLTDIDAFKAIHATSHDSDFHGLAIGVISPETPKELEAETDFTLNGVNDVERFLEWISEALPRIPI